VTQTRAQPALRRAPRTALLWHADPVRRAAQVSDVGYADSPPVGECGSTQGLCCGVVFGSETLRRRTCICVQLCNCLAAVCSCCEAKTGGPPGTDLKVGAQKWTARASGRQQTGLSVSRRELRQAETELGVQQCMALLVYSCAGRVGACRYAGLFPTRVFHATLNRPAQRPGRACHGLSPLNLPSLTSFRARWVVPERFEGCGHRRGSALRSLYSQALTSSHKLFTSVQWPLVCGSRQAPS
jgi:hypothetical protein